MSDTASILTPDALIGSPNIQPQRAPYYGNVHKRVAYFGVFAPDLVTESGQMVYTDGVRAHLEEEGRIFLARGTALEELDRSHSAADQYRRATDYLHFAQFMLPVSPQRQALQDIMRRAFKGFVETASNGLEIIDQITPAGRLVGFGRFADQHQTTLILIGGLDSSKEVELYYFMAPLFSRGINVICVDFPGQGENFGQGALHYDFDAFLAEVARYARCRAPHTNLGVFGVSLGGFLAMRALQDHDDVKFAASLGGFYDYRAFAGVREAAKPTLYRCLFGKESPDRVAIAEVTLERPFQCVDKPLFYLNGSKDHLVDESQIDQIRSRFQRAECLIINGAEHVATSKFPHLFPYVADWCRTVGAGADAGALVRAYGFQ